MIVLAVAKLAVTQLVLVYVKMTVMTHVKLHVYKIAQMIVQINALMLVIMGAQEVKIQQYTLP